MDNEETLVLKVTSLVDTTQLKKDVERIKAEFEKAGEEVRQAQIAVKAFPNDNDQRRRLNDAYKKFAALGKEYRFAQNALSQAEVHNRAETRGALLLQDAGTRQDREKRLEEQAKKRERESFKRRLKYNNMISRVARKFENVAIARLARGILNAVINSTKTGIQDLYKWSQSHNGAFAKAIDSITQDFRYISDILGTIFGPFIEALAPVIRNIADAFAAAAEKANQFFAVLLGRNGYYRALRVAKQYAGLQNQLLGFDELNVLKGDNGSGAGGFEDVALGAFKELDFLGRMAMAGGYLQMGIGVIALALGHPYVGIGLILSGLATQIAVKTQDGSDVTQKARGMLNTITLIGSGSSLAMGIILASSGQLPLGIALIAAGAMGLTSAASLNWDAIVNAIKSPFGAILGFCSGMLLPLGAAVMATNLPLGIALMAVGAAGLVTAVKLNWEAIVNWVRTTFAKVLTIVSELSVAAGAILMLCPTTLPLGIALMGAGFVGLAAASGLNPDLVLNTIQQTLDTITTKVGTFLSDLLGKVWNAVINMAAWLDSVFGKGYNVQVDTPNGKKRVYVDPVSGFVTYYAHGGTPTTGTLFYAGEAGPEVVTSFNNQSTVYNEDQLAGSLSAANQSVVAAVYDMASAIVSAISQKSTGINVNDMLDAINTQSLRYGL